MDPMHAAFVQGLGDSLNRLQNTKISVTKQTIFTRNWIMWFNYC